MMIFGVHVGRKIVPPEPTPLEVATAAYVRAQHALLAAQTQAEDGAAEVRLYQERLARLRTMIDSLRADGTPQKASQ